MTGGDYAMVKSVESFGDCDSYAARSPYGHGAGDMLVGITEGARRRPSSARSRRRRNARRSSCLQQPGGDPRRVQPLLRARKSARDRARLPAARWPWQGYACRPRRRLAAGAALEIALARLIEEQATGGKPSPTMQGVDRCWMHWRRLAQDAMAGHIEFEERLYRAKGLATYYADRAIRHLHGHDGRMPTFMIPLFRKADDTASPPSWAFVTCACRRRRPGRRRCASARCLVTPADYRAMGVGGGANPRPSACGVGEVRDRCEAMRRGSPNGNAAVLPFGNRLAAPCARLRTAFDAVARPYQERRELVLGGRRIRRGASWLCRPGRRRST